MKTVTVTAPLSIDDLKLFYFEDKNVLYMIDYEKSTLKEGKLITYLSNLDIPADIDLSNTCGQDVAQLLAAYFQSVTICNINTLEHLAIETVLTAAGVVTTDNPAVQQVVDQHNELVMKWVKILQSLSVYNMSIVKDDSFKEFANSFPVNDTKSIDGINWISLLKHPQLYLIFSKIDQSTLEFYPYYFNEYLFKSHSLYHYWANENNPLFLLTYGIAEGLINTEEYIDMRKQSIEEIDRAASI